MTPSAPEPVAPSAEDVAVAKRAVHRFPKAIHPGRRVRLLEADGAAERPQEFVELPAAAVQLIQRVLTEMANGNAVTIIPVHAELTTQQAADLLGVSRPFIVKLLSEGRLPFRKVGTHRRIMFKDLMDYKHKLAADRQKVLDELAADAQELDENY